ncbi:MAG: ribosome small subunit-dependent GTPase A [Pseudomonadota bacterium]
MAKNSEDSTVPATVSAAYGRRMELELSNGDNVPARTRHRRLRVFCGDRVMAEPPSSDDDWIIDSIIPRDTELARTDSRGRREVLIANLTTLIVVAAPRPKPDWYMIDRMLGTGFLLGLQPILVFNKSDLIDRDYAELADYANIPIELFTTNALTGDGLDALTSRLNGELAALLGQSGVGKSSLLNALVPNASEATGAINDSTDEGRHTTVAARQIHLPGSGRIIDAPGVRDFAPHIESIARVQVAFPEILTASANCRFADCTHRSEPHCAVREALDDGAISERRYSSYRRLFVITQQLIEKRRPR